MRRASFADGASAFRSQFWHSRGSPPNTSTTSSLLARRSGIKRSMTPLYIVGVIIVLPVVLVVVVVVRVVVVVVQ